MSLSHAIGIEKTNKKQFYMDSCNSVAAVTLLGKRITTNEQHCICFEMDC